MPESDAGSVLVASHSQRPALLLSGAMHPPLGGRKEGGGEPAAWSVPAVDFLWTGSQNLYGQSCAEKNSG